MVKRKVHLCAFGHPFRKATNLWTGLLNWLLGGVTGDGLCHNRCGQGSWDQGHYHHHFTIGGPSEKGPKGPGRTALRNAMPAALLREVLDAALQDASPNQTVVIDLCAGWGALQSVVLEYPNLIYVPVDIRLRAPISSYPDTSAPSSKSSGVELKDVCGLIKLFRASLINSCPPPK